MSDTTTDSTGPLTVANVDRRLIERLYGRFASVYDAMFGRLLHAGRREAMRELPLTSGDEISTSPPPEALQSTSRFVS